MFCAGVDDLFRYVCLRHARDICRTYAQCGFVLSRLFCFAPFVWCKIESAGYKERDREKRERKREREREMIERERGRERDSVNRFCSFQFQLRCIVSVLVDSFGACGQSMHRVRVSFIRTGSCFK